MQELTPRAVPSAVRMASRLCTTNFQISFLLIVVLSPFFFTLVCSFFDSFLSLSGLFLPFRKVFSLFRKPYFSVLTSHSQMLPEGFLSFRTFLPFRKVLPLFRKLPISSLSSELSSFSENLSFGLFRNPLFLFGCFR